MEIYWNLCLVFLLWWERIKPSPGAKVGALEKILKIKSCLFETSQIWIWCEILSIPVRLKPILIFLSYSKKHNYINHCNTAGFCIISESLDNVYRERVWPNNIPQGYKLTLLGSDKWSPFHRRHFRMQLPRWQSSIFDENFTELCSWAFIRRKVSSVQLCHCAEKETSTLEPILTKIYYDMASQGHNELTH